MQVDKIVDCRGIGATPLKVVNPALCSLLERGLVRLDPLGIGIDVASDCAVIDQRGIASERLFEPVASLQLPSLAAEQAF